MACGSGFGYQVAHTTRILPSTISFKPQALNDILVILSRISLHLRRTSWRHNGNNFPCRARHLDRLLLDDRSWFTSSATLCAAIGRTWRREMELLPLSENEGKAHYAAAGRTKSQRLLKLTLLSTNTRAKSRTAQRSCPKGPST